jgi:hypothetical protein
MDATQPVEIQQRILREAIRPHLPEPRGEEASYERI